MRKCHSTCLLPLPHPSCWPGGCSLAPPLMSRRGMNLKKKEIGALTLNPCRGFLHFRLARSSYLALLSRRAGPWAQTRDWPSRLDPRRGARPGAAPLGARFCVSTPPGGLGHQGHPALQTGAVLNGKSSRERLFILFSDVSKPLQLLLFSMSTWLEKCPFHPKKALRNQQPQQAKRDPPEAFNPSNACVLSTLRKAREPCLDGKRVPAVQSFLPLCRHRSHVANTAQWLWQRVLKWTRV